MDLQVTHYSQMTINWALNHQQDSGLRSFYRLTAAAFEAGRVRTYRGSDMNPLYLPDAHRSSLTMGAMVPTEVAYRMPLPPNLTSGYLRPVPG